MKVFGPQCLNLSRIVRQLQHSKLVASKVNLSRLSPTVFTMAEFGGDMPPSYNETDDCILFRPDMSDVPPPPAYEPPDVKGTPLDSGTNQFGNLYF